MLRRLSLVLFLFFSVALLAQKTTIYLDADKNFKSALELFDKKQFGSALKLFQETINTHKKPNDLIRIDAEYYAAVCAIELFNKDGEWRMRNFIQQHPEHNKVPLAYFYLGKSNFRKKKYDETIRFMEKVDIYEMTKEDLAELYFKRGYSYLETGNKEKAKADLYEIKDVDNKYAKAANYYYSHIAYSEKNYALALEGFQRLVGNETFGPVVPYYITQIYFLQGKYEEVIKNGPSLLNDTLNAQKADEINQIIGESYFKLKQYDKALPYLLKHNPATPEENYKVGYCYYQTGDCSKAVSYLEKAVLRNDTLAQNAHYHLADCYIKLQDKSKARSAFYLAYDLGFDPKIKEDALYSYARLCYETGFSPYNDAVKSFSKYITDYPNSTRKEEAYRFLINCFHSTKNYKLAMETIDRMKTSDLTLKQVYQRMAYFRGVEFFNNNQSDSAKKYFQIAIANAHDAPTAALAKYWIGEIQFAKKEYNTAIETWKAFQLMPGSFNLKEYDFANYNIGYAYFHSKNYTDAGVSFRKFIISKSAGIDALKTADANVRTGDCYFMTKNFSGASDAYETAIAINKIDVDYAMFQKALCNGLTKNYKEKANELKALMDRFPNSNYVIASIFETGEAYKMQNDYNTAISWYDQVVNKYPASGYYIPSLKIIGILYFNQNHYQKSFDYLDKVVKNNPKSDEAKDALETIKKIFKEQNKPEELESYVASVGGSLSANELDESYWEKAYDLYYTQKNCNLAQPEMQKYISKFPDGKYITEANFCFAECAYSKNEFALALPSYRYVIAKNRNVFTEVSLVKASYILYKDKNFEEALSYYQKLQTLGETPQNKLSGKLGAMRCAWYLKKYDIAIDEANKVINTEKISSQQMVEAKSIKARSLFELSRRDEALEDFKWLSKNAKSETGAEAYYHIALIQFSKKEYKEVEKTVNALVNYSYTSNDWNTRGMLLMADVYVAKGDDATAEAVLNSIIENADKQDYIDQAKQKLEEMEKRKNARLMPDESGSQMMIQFDNSGGNRLFDAPVNANDSIPVKKP